MESAGWRLSGLQKTTSLDFQGRWEGESTRSAYLFFHPADEREDASVDVYLDETSRGLAGNLALVVDLAPLSELGDPAAALRLLGGLSKREIPSGCASPLTLRLRLPDGATEPAEAEAEVRFKLIFPSRVIAAGASEVRGVAVGAVASFQRILGASELATLRRVP